MFAVDPGERVTIRVTVLAATIGLLADSKLRKPTDSTLIRYEPTCSDPKA